MLGFQWIKGLTVGLEYIVDEETGWTLYELSLGFFRIMYIAE